MGKRRFSGFDAAFLVSERISDMVVQRSKFLAGLLAICVGGLGIHNFYLGFAKRGTIQLLISVLSFGTLAAISGVWGIVEGILILCSKPGEKWHRDVRGVELSD